MEELMEILSDIRPDVDFENCTTLIDDKILDSFDIISIITELNSQMDVAVPADQIIPENFNSAKALWAMVEKLQDE
ncbi:MAG: acyl carrier protein [Clostridia bacterium]|jgi:acyl carrier protein|nr:acyl carrier protein [Bacteroidales bacterium]MBQ3931250.1 acyl carrier protein [Bacillota bacterium]MBR3302241.1 acyl carrier protein [Bacillota bacterium]MBR6236922.1 acyl carrier protein [Bacillota bacterium]MCR5009646.1 acyl carrier protein [Clostridia bacterium]